MVASRAHARVSGIGHALHWEHLGRFATDMAAFTTGALFGALAGNRP
jgi:hypothetical protein